MWLDESVYIKAVSHVFNQTTEGGEVTNAIVITPTNERLEELECRVYSSGAIPRRDDLPDMRHFIDIVCYDDIPEKIKHNEQRKIFMPFSDPLRIAAFHLHGMGLTDNVCTE